MHHWRMRVLLAVFLAALPWVVLKGDASETAEGRAVVYVAPDGTLQGVHRKLYPFMGERQSVQPGRAATAFHTALGRLGVEICFDSCYTGPTRRIAAAGARLIAMPNYDPPTRHGILHRLHAAVLPFRAVENRVPFVRADPNGLSQIVDCSGAIIAEAPLFAPDALVADVTLRDGRGTPFTRMGDWFVFACLAGIGALVLVPAWTSTGRRDT